MGSWRVVLANLEQVVRIERIEWYKVKLKLKWIK